MRVAVAGSGDLARYLSEEFPKAGHELFVLTRSHKPQFERSGVTQFITDYTLESLSAGIADAEVLISTIGEVGSSYIDVHRTLIQACQKSPKCKRFIPSEFGGDIEAHPDQPAFYKRTREPIRAVLRENADGLEWTLVSVGWLADYTVPVKNRYIKDLGEACPVNITGGSIVIPATGNEAVSLTWARDVAKALAALVDAKVPWEPYTFIAGDNSNWNGIADVVKRYHPGLTTKHRPLAEIAKALDSPENEDDQFVADHQMYSASESSSLPRDKVNNHREKYFSGVEFRTLQEGLFEYEQNAELVV